MVKIYSRIPNVDTEYKTLSITKSTTCREVIRMLLAKLRMKDYNCNLFYLTIDVVIKNPGVPIQSVIILDDKACPAQLQSVYPYQGTKFTLEMKSNSIIKLPVPCHPAHLTQDAASISSKCNTLDSRSSNESTNDKEYPCTSRASLTDESCSSTCTLDSCCSCDSSEVESDQQHQQHENESLFSTNDGTPDILKSPAIHWPSFYIRPESIH